MHIDLGYSFGTGALLPVPELIPFRLTRELEAPLEPVGARRVLTSHLETTLRTLRQPRARAPLWACWRRSCGSPCSTGYGARSTTLRSDRDADDAEAGAAAAPERRVATARGKLFGANPLPLATSRGRGEPDARGGHGPARADRRLRVGEQRPPRLAPPIDANVEDQVKVLVDLATDPASLGRLRCGLTVGVRCLCCERERSPFIEPKSHVVNWDFLLASWEDTKLSRRPKRRALACSSDPSARSKPRFLLASCKTLRLAGQRRQLRARGAHRTAAQKTLDRATTL